MQQPLKNLILSRTSSIKALQGRKTARLLKAYKSTADIEIGKQLLSSFSLESRSNNNSPLKRGLPKRGTQNRKRRERYEAAVRSCELNHSDILLILIRTENVDPERVSPKTGQTLLITAVLFGHMDCCLALLSQRGVNINKTDRWNWAPIHYACIDTNRFHLLEQFIRKKAKKNLKDGIKNRTPFELCCESGNEAGAILLLNAGCKIKYNIPLPKGFGLTDALPKWAIPQTRFCILAVLFLVLSNEGDVTRLTSLLNFIDQTTFERSQEEPACRARHIENGRQPIINYDQTPHNETSLMRAATKGHASVLNLILGRSMFHRKNINTVSERVGSALGLACEIGSIDSVVVLVRYGALVNRQEIHSGLTPLMTAVKNNDNPKLIRCLLDRRANIDQQDTRDGFSAIMVAAWCGMSENVIELLENEADLLLVSHAKVNVFMMCCAKHLTSAVQQMLQKNKTYNTDSEQDEEEEEEEEYLAENSNDNDGKEVSPASLQSFQYNMINMKDEDGWNSLRWACEGDAIDIVMLLLNTKKIKIDSNAFDVDASGAWIDPPWILPYIKCVTIKVEKHLREQGLERWIGSVPIDDLLVSAHGDYNVAMKLSVIKAKKAIAHHEMMEREMRRLFLKAKVRIERKHRARGGKNYSVTGEVSSILDKGATRSSTTSVNDLAFMLLPILGLEKPPKATDGVWNVLNE